MAYCINIRWIKSPDLHEIILVPNVSSDLVLYQSLLTVAQ